MGLMMMCDAAVVVVRICVDMRDLVTNCFWLCRACETVLDCVLSVEWPIGTLITVWVLKKNCYLVIAIAVFYFPCRFLIQVWEFSCVFLPLFRVCAGTIYSAGWDLWFVEERHKICASGLGWNKNGYGCSWIDADEVVHWIGMASGAWQAVCLDENLWLGTTWIWTKTKKKMKTKQVIIVKWNK